jgi:hypothetical protein
MRLINVDSMQFEEFSGPPPPYAILSHRWLPAAEEVSYDEFQDIKIRQNKRGFDKIRQTCQLARMDGIKFAWVDTCCIKKSDSAELSEAINSMFLWYKKSDICYAYLDDVTSNDARSPEFAGSRWFTRGWTLQELIAPLKVVFYGKYWGKIHEKSELVSTLQSITGINAGVLQGEPLDRVAVAKRMSWAARRQTTREEDVAYCLLGIFNVNMAMLYGEGSKAFVRLQEEIMKDSDDQSLFAWTATNESAARFPYRGLFADSPHEFVNCDDIIPFRNIYYGDQIPPTVTSRGIRLSTLINTLDAERGTRLLGLNCRRGSDFNNIISIQIRSQHGDQYRRSMPSLLFTCTPPGNQGVVFVEKSTHATEADMTEADIIPTLSRQHAFYFKYMDEGFRVHRTYPENLRFAPREGFLEHGPLILQPQIVLISCRWRRAYLRLQLYTASTEDTLQIQCFFRADWVLFPSQVYPSKYLCPKPNLLKAVEKKYISYHIGLFALLGTGYFSPLQVIVKPNKVQEHDVFCIEIRKGRSFEGLGAEWLIILLQVLLGISAGIAQLDPTRVAGFVFLPLFVGSLMVPMMFFTR